MTESLRESIYGTLNISEDQRNISRTYNLQLDESEQQALDTVFSSGLLESDDVDYHTLKWSLQRVTPMPISMIESLARKVVCAITEGVDPQTTPRQLMETASAELHAGMDTEGYYGDAGSGPSMPKGAADQGASQKKATHGDKGEIAKKGYMSEDERMEHVISVLKSQMFINEQEDDDDDDDEEMEESYSFNESYFYEQEDDDDDDDDEEMEERQHQSFSPAELKKKGLSACPRCKGKGCDWCEDAGYFDKSQRPRHPLESVQEKGLPPALRKNAEKVKKGALPNQKNDFNKDDDGVRDTEESYRFYEQDDEDDDEDMEEADTKDASSMPDWSKPKKHKQVSPFGTGKGPIYCHEDGQMPGNGSRGKYKTSPVEPGTYAKGKKQNEATLTVQEQAAANFLSSCGIEVGTQEWRDGYRKYMTHVQVV
jgi:hypothetical protein